MVRVEAEGVAPVVIDDAGRRVDHARAEVRPVRFDQADRVAVAVDDPDEDRAAAGRVRGRGGDRRPPRVDPGRELRGVGGIQQPLDRDGPCLRVGQPAVAVGHRELRRLDAEVDPGGSVTPSGPNADAGGGSNRDRIESSSRATIPELFGGWVVTRTPR